MKRFKFAWLLVLPYVVVASSPPSRGWQIISETNQRPDGVWTLNSYTNRFGQFESREFSDDLAESLNEAHEARRIRNDTLHTTMVDVNGELRVAIDCDHLPLGMTCKDSIDNKTASFKSIADCQKACLSARNEMEFCMDRCKN